MNPTKEQEREQDKDKVSTKSEEEEQSPKLGEGQSLNNEMVNQLDKTQKNHSIELSFNELSFNELSSNELSSNELSSNELPIKMENRIQKKSMSNPRKIIKKSIGGININIPENVVLNQNESSNLEVLVEDKSNINNSSNEIDKNEIDFHDKSIINECISIITQCDPDQICSKKELILRIEYQRDLLLKKNQGIKNQKILAMDKILADLKAEEFNNNLCTIKEKREHLNHQILKNKIDSGIFKQKINLTREKKPGEIAQHLELFFNSKQYWKKEIDKQRSLPPKDKELYFNKTRGNKKLSPQFQKMLYN